MTCKWHWRGGIRFALWLVALCFLVLSLHAQCTTVAPGICNTGLSTAQNNLLGPLTPYGSNPWIFGDLAEKATADNMAPAALALAPMLGTALAGTVSHAQGTQTIATTADLTTPLAGQSWVAVAWNTVDGTGTGRALCPIQSVTSTTITCSENLFEPNFSGVSAFLLPPPAPPSGLDFQSWTTENPSVVWNYYDVAIGLYRLYYRTLTTTYQTDARAYSDIQWQWVIDHGYRLVAPRAGAMISQFLRASEGLSGRWPGLFNWISLQVPQWANPAASPAIDNREAGYVLWDIALGAKNDTDPTRHAQYCTWLGTYVPTWNSVQAPDGSWPEEEYMLNPTFVSAPKTFISPFLYQGAPWREAINVKAMEAAYESLNDTTSQGCNNPTLATATLTAITNAVTWQNNYGRDTSNRGIYYEVNSQSDDQDTIANPPGTVSITLGSTALVGVGASFLSTCTSDPFIGFNTTRQIYKLASCADDTHATLTVNYGLYGESSNLSASTIALAPAAFSGCHSSATWCFGSAGDRNLTRTYCGDIGWLYGQTLNSTYLGWTNECLSAQLGGPTAGLTSAANITSFVLPCTGAACDGYVSDAFTGAANCGDTSNIPPCVYGGSLYSNMGKNFGEAFGAPGIDNALGWRLFSTPTSPTITSTSPLPSGVVGTPYSFTFTATGTTPITWTGTGLPGWATLASGGLFSGTPSAAATTTFNVTATNTAGSAGPSPFTITVTSAAGPTCSPKTHVSPPNVTDVQLQTNMALGVIACTNSLTGSGCTVVDVQRVVNALLGGACVVGP